MSDKKKQDKRRLKGLTSQSMSMSFFLMRIMGIHNEALAREEITHRELAQIFPNLKRTGYDYILDNPQVVYNGDVILVRDATDAVVPYIIPEHLKNLSDLGMDDVMDNEEWDSISSEDWVTYKEPTPNIQDYDLKSMSIYDLEKLLKIYSQTHQTGNYQKVRREIISRRDSIQGNRMSKAKALHKELKFRHYSDDENDFF